MSLKEDFTTLKGDVEEIKKDLNEHMRRTSILEARQDVFEANMNDFKNASKNIETTSLIIQKVYKPFMVIIGVGASSVALPQFVEILKVLINLF